MQMLDSSDINEPEVEVTRTDQDKINKFSNLNLCYEDLEVILKTKKDEIDYLSELETELMMIDEDELVMYKLDTSFIHLNPIKAIELTENNKQKLIKMVEGLQEDLDRCDQEMKELKKVLYSKFGKSINLERNDPI
ncbi:hypothetical protein CROQUDRAFT_671223 [Cronartium quercuum f. sp. fusiforme G11]|uniref:Prefoldin subunit 4 n=1 Tax=Cronartium quercuum f. sp. fusiforme G11 TaxID=708437 RepID=A0A9P6TD68_9BASI|nr:hypothetical protein CROQUDRAFT_671223 [Cronartium quercuum f. sp. fusiforme G11]